jgi:hypothetical protein
MFQKKRGYLSWRGSCFFMLMSDMFSSVKQSSDTSQSGVFFDDTAEAPPMNMEAAYRTAEELGWRQLAGRDATAQAERCGAVLKEGAFELLFFHQRLRVLPERRTIVELESGKPVGVWERVLVLHYLASTDVPAPGEELIEFKNVPAGAFYYDAYRRRCHLPLARTFGQRPGLLLEAGRVLGGEPADFGDAAVRLWPFARVPVVAVVYAADEEFPADASILYRPSVSAYFCTEDIAVLGGLVAGRLVREARRLEQVK